jgi:hypothetical protein
MDSTVPNLFEWLLPVHELHRHCTDTGAASQPMNWGHHHATKLVLKWVNAEGADILISSHNHTTYSTTEPGSDSQKN